MGHLRVFGCGVGRSTVVRRPRLWGFGTAATPRSQATGMDLPGFTQELSSAAAEKARPPGPAALPGRRGGCLALCTSATLLRLSSLAQRPPALDHLVDVERLGQ